MSLLALDVNATRVRAVWGGAGDYPNAAMLDPPRAELPVALSLEGRTPVAGLAAVRMCRKTPHLTLQNFLPRIGIDSVPGRNGTKSRSQLSPDAAVALVLQRALHACRFTTGVVLALPAYLSGTQVETMLTVACHAGLPVMGSIIAPVATALASHAEQTWFSAAVVLDIDDHALTLATVNTGDGQAQLLDVRSFPHLNLRVWQGRLLNALADCCIMESRWDPRESPQADQALFDQLDEVLDAAQHGRVVKVTVQTPKRYQSLVLPAHSPATFCSNLRRQVLAEVENLFTGPWPDGAPGTLLITAAAARLPGLTLALQSALPKWTPTATVKPPKTASALEDFGTSLLDDHGCECMSVVELGAGAAAHGAHAVGAFFQRGDLALGHLDVTAPLPLPLPLDAGPARLHFQGRDYLLGRSSFTLGRQPTADLVIDGEQWPQVAGRHCDIIYDHRVHMLCNRCQDGTLINDKPAKQAVPLRPGDWIRLGPNGPVLRFLGQAENKRNHE